MIGIQAAGAAPVFRDKVVEKPETVASAIRIGNPASWDGAKRAVRESTGAVDIVTDEEILEAQRWLASHEGIFVEPASAAPVAGLFKSCDPRRKSTYPLSGITAGSRIVCTVTGHGLKDPDIAGMEMEQGTVPPNESDVLRALDL
jgi:threonine synthase